MTRENDHQITNLRRRELELRQKRITILSADGQKALEMVLDAPAPATLIQSFPDQDLYYLIHKIGPEDCVPILSYAASSQWEYLLDMETWDQDRLDLAPMTKIFDLLFQADPDRLIRWGISRKTSLFEFYLSKHMEIQIREHDELVPSDFDDYITLDDKFYFRFPEKPEDLEGDGTDASELIEKMLNRLADMDLSVFHGLLLETQGLLPAETEEEEFRLKSIRLAEKGFAPAHEAVGIYQPVPPDSLRKRPGALQTFQSALDPDITLPPQYFSQFIKGENLIVSTLKQFEAPFIYGLESELAALINKVISADKIKLRAAEDLEKAIKKTLAYLNLGLETILGDSLNLQTAKDCVSTYFLEDIFRAGSGICLRLKNSAHAWFRQSAMNRLGLPLSFLDETFLGIIGGLLIERPMVFDVTLPHPPYRDFCRLSDIDATNAALQQIMDIDRILGRLDIDLTSFKQGVLTYKTLFLTLWAKSRLNLSSTLEPIPADAFSKFFAELFTPSNNPGQTHILMEDFCEWISGATGLDVSGLSDELTAGIKALMMELWDEYAPIPPGNLDPRFIPHFLLEKTKP